MIRTKTVLIVVLLIQCLLAQAQELELERESFSMGDVLKFVLKHDFGNKKLEIASEHISFYPLQFEENIIKGFAVAIKENSGQSIDIYIKDEKKTITIKKDGFKIAETKITESDQLVILDFNYQSTHWLLYYRWWLLIGLIVLTIYIWYRIYYLRNSKLNLSQTEIDNDPYRLYVEKNRQGWSSNQTKKEVELILFGPNKSEINIDDVNKLMKNDK